VESWQENRNGTSATYYRVTGPVVPSLLVNQFVYFEPKSGEAPFYGQVKQISGKTAVLQTLRDYSHAKNSVWGITARNREQNFALNLLMNPEVDFITLLGQAGTGKTLLALAAGLAQVLETKLYNEIIVTRVTVPVGEDIGFLPGTEEEKMSPWMGAFDDNLEVLMKSDSEAGDWGRAATQDLIRSHLREQVPDHRRGAEPDAQADEDAGHARRPGHQDPLPWQHRADRHAVPDRRLERTDLCGGPLQGLGPRRARDAGARRAFAPGGSRDRRAVISAWSSKKTCAPCGPQVFFTPLKAPVKTSLMFAPHSGPPTPRGD
jgi:hypothetical protein